MNHYENTEYRVTNSWIKKHAPHLFEWVHLNEIFEGVASKIAVSKESGECISGRILFMYRGYNQFCEATDQTANNNGQVSKRNIMIDMPSIGFCFPMGSHALPLRELVNQCPAIVAFICTYVCEPCSVKAYYAFDAFTVIAENNSASVHLRFSRQMNAEQPLAKIEEHDRATVVTSWIDVIASSSQSTPQC